MKTLFGNSNDIRHCGGFESFGSHSWRGSYLTAQQHQTEAVHEKSSRELGDHSVDAGTQLEKGSGEKHYSSTDQPALLQGNSVRNSINSVPVPPNLNQNLYQQNLNSFRPFSGPNHPSQHQFRQIPTTIQIPLLTQFRYDTVPMSQPHFTRCPYRISRMFTSRTYHQCHLLCLHFTLALTTKILNFQGSMEQGFKTGGIMWRSSRLG